MFHYIGLPSVYSLKLRAMTKLEMLFEIQKEKREILHVIKNDIMQIGTLDKRLVDLYAKAAKDVQWAAILVNIELKTIHRGRRDLPNSNLAETCARGPENRL